MKLRGKNSSFALLREYIKEDGAKTPVKAEIIAVNEPRTLKAIVPADLEAGEAYVLKVVTQSSAHGSYHILKEARIIRSEFSLTAQA